MDGSVAFGFAAFTYCFMSESRSGEDGRRGLVLATVLSSSSKVVVREDTVVDQSCDRSINECIVLLYLALPCLALPTVHPRPCHSIGFCSTVLDE